MIPVMMIKGKDMALLILIMILNDDDDCDVADDDGYDNGVCLSP